MGGGGRAEGGRRDALMGQRRGAKVGMGHRGIDGAGWSGGGGRCGCSGAEVTDGEDVGGSCEEGKDDQVDVELLMCLAYGWGLGYGEKAMMCCRWCGPYDVLQHCTLARDMVKERAIW